MNQQQKRALGLTRMVEGFGTLLRRLRHVQSGSFRKRVLTALLIVMASVLGCGEKTAEMPEVEGKNDRPCATISVERAAADVTEAESQAETAETADKVEDQDVAAVETEAVEPIEEANAEQSVEGESELEAISPVVDMTSQEATEVITPEVTEAQTQILETTAETMTTLTVLDAAETEEAEVIRRAEIMAVTEVGALVGITAETHSFEPVETDVSHLRAMAPATPEETDEPVAEAAVEKIPEMTSGMAPIAEAKDAQSVQKAEVMIDEAALPFANLVENGVPQLNSIQAPTMAEPTTASTDTQSAPTDESLEGLRYPTLEELDQKEMLSHTTHRAEITIERQAANEMAETLPVAEIDLD
ncbi:MAG: hypothetical protein ACYTGH_04670, partial [Planctomycetota bacterium]